MDKKKPTPKISKAKIKLQKQKKSAYNRIYRINNKLDKKPILAERRSLEKELRKVKKSIDYTKVSSREETRGKKEIKSIRVQQNALARKIRNPKTSKTESERARKQALILNKRLSEVKKNTGKKVSKNKSKVTKKSKKPGKKSAQEIQPIWVIRKDYLEPAMDSKNIKTIIFEGVSFKKKDVNGILDAMSQMNSDAILNGVTTPLVLIVRSYVNKNISFSLTF